jgi:ribulose-phosphate 3-epimerase
MIEIVPTVVPRIFDDVLEARKRYGAFAPTLHIDATDGVFAQSRTWLPLSGEKLPEAAVQKYEAHLMIENPLSIGVAFARAGAHRIIGHVEAFNNAECAREAFAMWEKAGAREVGIAIRLETPLEDLVPYLQLCDFVHVMTVASIGAQGGRFEEQSLERIGDIRARFPHLTISSDGGETVDSVDDLSRVGVTRFCIGAALAKAKDPEKEYARLEKAATALI